MKGKQGRPKKPLEPDPLLEDDEDLPDQEGEDEEERELSALATRRRIIQTAVVVAVMVAAIYILFPKIVGFEDALAKIGEGDPVWIAIAVGLNVLAFFAYVALFRGVVGERVLHLEWSESYQITMAGLAATRLFSAGGAGGIVLTYWALRKAGMAKRESARRMLTFLILLYFVYLASLLIFGVLLRTGVLSGNSPAGLTIVPAVFGGAVILIFGLIALVPTDLERRFARFAAGYRRIRWARRLATGPATLAAGVRTAVAFVSHPSQGSLAMAGAVGFWAANIAVLWASFKAFDLSVPLGVVVQGFFVGMIANLVPLAPGGVGAVDAGMIGAFVLFGLPDSSVFAAVLTYRVIAFWLPIPPGIVAFLQLRQTVQRWEEEGYTSKSEVGLPQRT